MLLGACRKSLQRLFEHFQVRFAICDVPEAGNEGEGSESISRVSDNTGL